MRARVVSHVFYNKLFRAHSNPAHTFLGLLKNVHVGGGDYIMNGKTTLH